LSDQESKSGISNDNAGYEKRDVNIGKVIAYGVGAIIILVILVVLALDFFVATREEIIYEAVLKPESAELRELRAREAEELNSYAVLDVEKGIYRIPIDRAMKLMAEEAFQKKTAGGQDK
jgi:hypothetical protein